jgi:hypothetical protein
LSDTITPAKGLTEPQVGVDTNWANLLNADLALIDTALGGTLSVSISGSTTLNSTQVENTGYKFSGTLSTAATITWPAFSGFAMIENNTTGGFSISCGISGGTFTTLFNGEAVSIWSDGTNFTKTTAFGHGHGTTGSGEVVLATSPTITSPTITSPTISSPTFSAPLSVANGGTGLDTYGALDGTSSAKTATYEVANSDKRSTISLGGDNCYAVTVPVASGFDSDFQVRLYNADTSRAKWLTISGYSSFFLWPGQNVVVQNISGAWQLYPLSQRWQNSALPFYVDPNGSDAGGANDGLTQASAFATITNAWNIISFQTDGRSPSIQLTPGATYTINSTIELAGDNFGAFGRLLAIIGDATLSNPSIISTSSSISTMIQIRDGMWSQITGIRFVSTAIDNFGVSMDQAGLCDLTNCEWNMPSAIFIGSSNQSLCNVFGIQSVLSTGSTINFASATNGSSILFSGTTIQGNSNATDFGGGFLLADLNSRIQLSSVTFSGTGSFSGPQYALTHGSFLSEGGATLPGSSGSADSTSAAY